MTALATSAAAGEEGSGRSSLARLTNGGLSMPSRLDGPDVDLTIRNDGTKAHELAVSHIKPGTTLAEVRASIANPGGGEPAFELDDPGGVWLLGPGTQVRYRRRLTPGLYAFWKIAVGTDPSEKDGVQLVQITDGKRRSRPETEGTLRLRDDAVTITPLSPGRHTFAVTNAGTMAHEVLVVGLRDDANIARADELGAWLEGGQAGPAPFPVEFPGSHQTIDPGVTVYLTWDLKPAMTYAFVDPQTGAIVVAATAGSSPAGPRRS